VRAALAKCGLRNEHITSQMQVILVCHEPEFYEDVVTGVWNVEDWSK